MKDHIRIASGQGFWGDLPNAPIRQVREGPIDYLVMDYLAEVTMSILQKQKMRNPCHGYAKDFVDVIAEILPDMVDRGIKVVSNAGGVNPEACKDAIREAMQAKGIDNLKIAVVDGDNILDQIDTLVSQGHELKNIDTDQPISTVQDRLSSANAYFGCEPIVEALRSEADIVITGRVIDAALVLGPLVYEFDWSLEDWNKMAAGIVAGHLIECGAQVSGGNFTDWQTVDNLANIGFPIVEARPDGDFYITKHEGTGGLINEMTVKEQLVYEIQDPSRYLTPNCIADFTSLSVEQVAKDCVKFTNVKGRERPDSYKISASYTDGYKLTSTMTYSWPDALKKAQQASDILQSRAEANGLIFERFRIDYLGINSINEQPLNGDKSEQGAEEITLRLAVSDHDEKSLNAFGKEMVPLVLTGPSGATGYAGGRPKASAIVAYWPALLARDAIEPRVRVFTSQDEST